MQIKKCNVLIYMDYANWIRLIDSLFARSSTLLVKRYLLSVPTEWFLDSKINVEYSINMTVKYKTICFSLG